MTFLCVVVNCVSEKTEDICCVRAKQQFQIFWIFGLSSLTSPFNWFLQCFSVESLFIHIYIDEDKKIFDRITLKILLIDWSAILVQNKPLHITPVIHVRSCYKVAHILIHTYHPWMRWLDMSPGMLAHISLPWHLSNPFWRHWSGHPHIILRVLVKNQSGFLTQLHNFTLTCIISHWGHFSKIFFLLVTTAGLSFRPKKYFFEYLLVQLCVAM